MKMTSNGRRKEIKDAILAIGSTTSWVPGEINDLVAQAIVMLENGKAKDVKHAAFKVIDQYY
ncbi:MULTISPECIES: hypothetical protein [Paenibacillus]|uniref:hypothetical protein n=1 Tax=Paenibacillus TaxID=44249 RepID=UPI00096D91B9|nr:MULTISPECIES: hypothetical protein [Paenibacillus]OMF48604.1 hypothetical protein BK135_09925 [Paenibacillus peoriae]QYK61839.1 hypothetical protein KAI37_02163 [Paenibacillus sp. S25]